MMRSKLSYAVLGMVSLLILAACGPGDGPDELPTMNIDMASASPESALGSQLILHWQNLVTERTDGRITFTNHWAGALLGTDDMFSGVRDGLAGIGAVPTSYVSGEIIDVAPLEVPFAFPLDEENWPEVTEQINPILDELFEPHAQKVLFATTLTPNPVTCRDRFLASPEDWGGTSVRTAGRWQSETMERWGGSPVFMPLGDLYTALERGTVDCTLLVYDLLVSFRIVEAAQYVTRIDHSIQYSVNTINRSVWDRLPESDQQIFLEAGRETELHGASVAAQAVEDSIQTMLDEGVQFCTPAEDELVRLVDASREVFDELRDRVGEQGHAMMDILDQYRDVVVQGPMDDHETTPC